MQIFTAHVVYELPFGSGKRFKQGYLAAAVLTARKSEDYAGYGISLSQRIPNLLAPKKDVERLGQHRARESAEVPDRMRIAADGDGLAVSQR
jgi:hypothetical protein